MATELIPSELFSGGVGETADLHSLDYYLFKKHAFFLRHLVQYAINEHTEYKFKGTVLFSLNTTVYLLHKPVIPLPCYMASKFLYGDTVYCSCRTFGIVVSQHPCHMHSLCYTVCTLISIEHIS